ncbi:hypothetical protein [Synechococcus sp. MIT S9508]|uniref:hypothetical protein n=1 Tax=Synechococcus sp. MIT S9508 TaxID=1801629 RepID=UPI0018D316D1|nr:hypothetical protein [Synechococcus sp. MIT S9508]
MAAINEAVNVEDDGAASDGVDMDETVIKNTKNPKETVAPCSRKQLQRQPKPKPILDALTTSRWIQNCSIEFTERLIGEHSFSHTSHTAESPESQLKRHHKFGA